MLVSGARFIFTAALTLLLACGSGPRQPAVLVAPIAEPSPPVVAQSPSAPAPPLDAAVPIEAADVLAPDFEVTLERTPCLGTCPAYTVTVNARGEVFFAGWYPAKGCATATIPIADVAALARRIEAMGYFGLKDEYVYPVTDHPWARTAVVSGGRTKLVAHYLADHLSLPDLPEREALVELERAIDVAAKTPLGPLGSCDGESPYSGVP